MPFITMIYNGTTIALIEHNDSEIYAFYAVSPLGNSPVQNNVIMENIGISDLAVKWSSEQYRSDYN